jgi:hypothetical protein
MEYGLRIRPNPGALRVRSLQSLDSRLCTAVGSGGHRPDGHRAIALCVMHEPAGGGGWLASSLVGDDGDHVLPVAYQANGIEVVLGFEAQPRHGEAGDPPRAQPWDLAQRPQGRRSRKDTCRLRPRFRTRVGHGAPGKTKGLATCIANPLTSMAPRPGLEPGTYGLTVRRSTD